jgi:hypothetical protein
MGSTVILLFPPMGVDWHSELRPLSTVRMGQAIGELLAQARSGTAPSGLPAESRPESHSGS